MHEKDIALLYIIVYYLKGIFLKVLLAPTSKSQKLAMIALIARS